MIQPVLRRQDVGRGVIGIARGLHVQRPVAGERAQGRPPEPRPRRLDAASPHVQIGEGGERALGHVLAREALRTVAAGRASGARARRRQGRRTLGGVRGIDRDRGASRQQRVAERAERHSVVDAARHRGGAVLPSARIVRRGEHLKACARSPDERAPCGPSVVIPHVQTVVDPRHVAVPLAQGHREAGEEPVRDGTADNGRRVGHAIAAKLRSDAAAGPIVGPPRVQHHRPAHGVPAEQGALRSAQDLDALQVEQVHGRPDRPGHVDAVNVHGNTGVRPGQIVQLTHAADEDLRSGFRAREGARGIEGEVGREVPQLVRGGDLVSLQVPAGERRDGERNILHGLPPVPCRHHDLGQGSHGIRNRRRRVLGDGGRGHKGGQRHEGPTRNHRPSAVSSSTGSVQHGRVSPSIRSTPHPRRWTGSPEPASR